ncbi:Hypp2747 [Branchiostoma lanceolatum]|uniref:Hypp2747 protein n=1 Tax=Branchiostoma lanceolatum TaxID=7740 RepID=A0A8J9ZX24_BRALA|nr:Hypp2747 [Branchiostoma lanceolatum]
MHYHTRDNRRGPDVISFLAVVAPLCRCQVSSLDELDSVLYCFLTHHDHGTQPSTVRKVHVSATMFSNLTTEVVANVTDSYSSPTIDRSTAESSTNGVVTLSPSAVFETPFFPSSTLAGNVTSGVPVNFTSSPPTLPSADLDITEYKLVVLVTGGIVSGFTVLVIVSLALTFCLQKDPSENQALDAALSVNIDPEKMLNGSKKRKSTRKGTSVSRLHSDGSAMRFWRNSSANSGRSIEELDVESMGVDNLGMEPVSEMTEMSSVKPANHDEDVRSLSSVKVAICESNANGDCPAKQGSDGDSGVSSTGSGRAAEKDSRRVLGWIESYL